MGNSSSSSASRQADAGVTGGKVSVFGSGTNAALKRHLETAEKTGTVAFPNQKLEQFPQQLTRVAHNLRNLDLSGNRLVSLSLQAGPGIEQFTQLRTLRLSGNRLGELPPSLGQLVKLEGLFVPNNRLTQLPRELAQCKNLKDLDASGNALSFVPSSLYGLKKLDYVDLSRNHITQFENDDQVGDISATELNLNQNQLFQLPASLSKCTRLKTLRLEENCLPMEAISSDLLGSSSVCSLFLAGNTFDEKKLSSIEGYEQYMERFAAVRRKLD